MAKAEQAKRRQIPIKEQVTRDCAIEGEKVETGKERTQRQGEKEDAPSRTATASARS